MRHAAWLTTATLIFGCAQGGPAGDPLVDVGAPLKQPAEMDAACTAAATHIDETHAVQPLERASVWEEGELPETYPWAV